MPMMKLRAQAARRYGGDISPGYILVYSSQTLNLRFPNTLLDRCLQLRAPPRYRQRAIDNVFLLVRTHIASLSFYR